jgi:hypothetical protein
MATTRSGPFRPISFTASEITARRIVERLCQEPPYGVAWKDYAVRDRPSDRRRGARWNEMRIPAIAGMCRPRREGISHRRGLTLTKRPQMAKATEPNTTSPSRRAVLAGAPVAAAAALAAGTDFDQLH